MHIETTKDGYIIDGVERTEADFHNAIQAQDGRGAGPTSSFDGVGWNTDAKDLQRILILSDGSKIAIRKGNNDEFIRLSDDEKTGWYCCFEEK